MNRTSRVTIPTSQSRRMSKAPRVFIDTTVVYYRLHSHSLLAEAVQKAVADQEVVVSNFVRGEYIRGYVIGLIDLYSAIKMENNVQDGIHLFNAEMMNNPRRVKNAFAATLQWLNMEDAIDVQKTLRRLGEAI